MGVSLWSSKGTARLVLVTGRRPALTAGRVTREALLEVVFLLSLKEK